MHYLAIFAGLAAAVSAAVLPRQDTSDTFNIPSIYASGSPHSSSVEWSFKVEDGIDCVTCSNVTYDGPYLFDVPTSCCTDDCSWTWSWETLYYNVYALTVTHYETSDYEIAVLYLSRDTYGVVAVDEANLNGDYEYLNVSGLSFQPSYTTYGF